MSRSISSLRVYPSNIQIFDTEGDSAVVDFDGTEGVFTRQEWRGMEPICEFNKEDQDRILDALENTSNVSFFQEEE